MSKDIKKALEHCVEWNCGNCPNRDELGSGETVCRGRLLPEVLEYVADLEAKLAESERKLEEYKKCNCKECMTDYEKNLNQIIDKYLNENIKLKQQLAEKDELIENYKMGYTGKVWKKQNKEISVLKSVVKDKDEIIDKLNNMIFNLSYIINNDANNSLYILEQVNDLKQQLAEKDKELKQLKLDLGMFKSVNEFINSYGIEKAREVLLQTEKTKNQDKISFALEQLEKVKEKLNDYDIQDILSSSSDPYGEFDENCVTTDKINQIIDQQIALLKGKVE